MKQLSIITENRLGIVTEITETLAEADINIETMDARQVDQFVVVVMTVDHYDRALQVIHKIKNTNIVTEDAILVKLVNEPGALAKISRRFTDAGIGLRSIRFIQRDSKYGLVAISTERTNAALELVSDVLVS